MQTATGAGVGVWSWMAGEGVRLREGGRGRTEKGVSHGRAPSGARLEPRTPAQSAPLAAPSRSWSQRVEEGSHSNIPTGAGLRGDQNSKRPLSEERWGERSEARPPASWPRPLTKSLNSPSRLDHLRDFLSEGEYFLCVFLSGSGRLGFVCCLWFVLFYASHSGHLSFPGTQSPITHPPCPGTRAPEAA